MRAGAHREQEAQAAAVAVITRAARDGDWRAQAWLIERRHPSRWGRRTSHELTGPEGGPIAVEEKLDLSKLTAGELETLQALLERAGGST